MTRALLIAFTLFVASCGGKKEESGGGDTGSGSAKVEDVKKGSGSAVADTGSGSGAGAGSGSGEVVKAALPTEVDFEDDSLTKITEKSVEADLTSLEKEIGDGEVKKDDGKDDAKKEEPKKEEKKAPTDKGGGGW